MANMRLGHDGEKVTEGVEVRFWLSPGQHTMLRERAVKRTNEEMRPVSMAQVLRELVDHALTHPPKSRRIKKDERSRPLTTCEGELDTPSPESTPVAITVRRGAA